MFWIVNFFKTFLICNVMIIHNILDSVENTLVIFPIKPNSATIDKMNFQFIILILYKVHIEHNCIN